MEAASRQRPLGTASWHERAAAISVRRVTDQCRLGLTESKVDSGSHTHLGTHKGNHCQESVRTWPGDYVLPPGLARLFFGVFLAAAQSFPVLEESSWSARSHAAARTNELDAGKRRKIIEGEEGPVCGFGL